MPGIHAALIRFIVIASISAETVMESGCHLVKLCERHPAIDFLIVDNPAGENSRRLFLIQVSAMKYQNRGASKKVGAVLKPVIDGQTPVNFYCAKTKVDKKKCFFVFASPEVPLDDSFTRATDDVNIIYFMVIMVSK